jgi:hypothetical protein
MNNLKRFALLALGIVALMAVVVGCGDDGQASGEDQTASGPPITKAEFVRKANKLCENLTDRLLAEASPAELREAEDESDAEAIENRLVPAVEGQIDELRALGTPEGDEEQLNTFYETLEGVMQSAKANPQRFLSELGNFERPYGEVERLAKAYGIAVCAQP